MRYVQLRAFHYVAISGGFSRAAEALHLTQPAISDQVRKLESQYDVRLFNREKKQVTLTGSGEKLLEITRRMFEIEDQALELLSQTREEKSGTLTIVADAAHHVTDILRPFQRKHPDVFITMSGGNTQTIIGRLNAYDADIGIVGGMPQSGEYEVIKLGSSPIMAFASYNGKFGKLRSIGLEDFANLPLVLRESGSKTRAKFEDLAQRRGIDLQIRIEAEGREAVREIVASGDGVGIVSEAEFGKDSRLVKIPITDAGLTMDETLICLKERRESRLIRAFMELARTATG
jgi:aminoethylphosphonate catabolism LysR family transcriptional regulator